MDEIFLTRLRWFPSFTADQERKSEVERSVILYKSNNTGKYPGFGSSFSCLAPECSYVWSVSSPLVRPDLKLKIFLQKKREFRWITFSAGTRSHLVVAVELSSFKFCNLCCLQLLLPFLSLCHFLLIFMEGLKVARNDWDGEGEDQDSRHSAHWADQLAQSCNIGSVISAIDKLL